MRCHALWRHHLHRHDMSMHFRSYKHFLTDPWMVGTWTVILRVALGMLLVYHGSSKVFDGTAGMTEKLTSYGWPLAGFQAFLATYTEFLGGVLLIVGLFTRPAAIMSIGLFSIIVFVFFMNDPFSKKELPVVFLLLSMLVFFFGPGRVSVDYYLFKKNAAPAPDLPSKRVS